MQRPLGCPRIGADARGSSLVLLLCIAFSAPGASAQAAPPTHTPSPGAPQSPDPARAGAADVDSGTRQALSPPQPLADTDVAYPAGASGDAQVELELVVGATGDVTSARVIRGDAPFAEAARAAAESFRFAPARRDGVPVAARIRFLVSFEQRVIAGDTAQPTETAKPAEDATPSAVAVPPPPPPQPLEVTVTGLRSPGSKSISRAFARQLPGAFGNPFAAIEASPGVTPTLSGAPYFYVRGAPPGNLGYSIDDIRLPALFHVLAGPSVLHPALVENIDFHPGPYPARYGRFTGGIAAGKVRRPSYELHGEVSVRAFDSSGLVEVPLSAGESPTSLTLGGRVSYANPIAHLFAPEVSVSYWDYQARLSHEFSPRDELALLVFGSRDDLDRTQPDGEREVVFGAEFHRLQLRYERQLERGSARIMAVGGWDRSDQADGGVELKDTLGQLRADVTQRFGQNWQLDAGIDGGLDSYELHVVALDDEGDRADYLERFPSRVDSVAGAYATATVEPLAGVRVNFGSRLDVYGSQETLALGISPSVLAEFDVGRSLTLVHGLGIAHQPPSNTVPQPGANPVLGSGLQHAVQESAGIRLKLPSDVQLEATLFQTALFNLTDSVGISRIDNGDDSLSETSRATGSSRGFEFLLERRLGADVGGYIAYTLASSRRSAGRAEGPGLFDRRHVLSAALAARLGNGFHSGLRGTFYTGVPADVAYLAAARDPPRTSPFYRIDVRLEKRWRLNDAGAYWSVVLEVLNTTLNEEALGKSCSAYVCREDTVGPLTVPSLGLEAMF